MKLGVLTVPLYSMPLGKALEYIRSLGAEMAEIGCGGFPGKGHCDPAVLLHDDNAMADFKKIIDDSGMTISAFSCHGNPVHPNQEIAAQFDRDLHDAVLMAEAMGVHQINTFSGCPGDCAQSQRPNWVVCPWPNDFLEILDYQWNEVLIPYWKQFAEFASQHGVNKIALELHPGFCVYNGDSLLRLREAVGGSIIGANLDPSHLIWQGIDPVAMIKRLGGDAIHHFHAKDTRIDAANRAFTGVLDTKPYADELNRSWIFRTVGYGNDADFWKDIISALRMVGYDWAISIEHEDSLMSGPEGLRKACAFLKDILIEEPAGDMFWV